MTRCPQEPLSWMTRSSAWRRGMLRRLACGSAILALVTPAVLASQADRVDAGTFSVFEDGQRVGREQFSFRKAPAPDGSAYELRAESTRGDARTAVQSTTDSAGSPIRYSLEIRDDLSISVRMGGQRVRGRFATLRRTSAGESAREYLLAPGTIAVEANLFHQLCFLIRGRSATAASTFSVPVLAPLDNIQQTWRVSLESVNDTVTIAGVVKPARRWRVDSDAGDIRTLWADSDGRVLRVVIPARRVEAIRDDIPRP